MITKYYNIMIKVLLKNRHIIKHKAFMIEEILETEKLNASNKNGRGKDTTLLQLAPPSSVRQAIAHS